jgi:cobalt-zinc-cadmium efflux system protein
MMEPSSALNNQSRMKWAIMITGLLFLAQCIGGWMTNSLAIISDAWHLLSDLGALLLSWFALRQTQKPANEVHTFGYHRYGILAALINGLALIGISIFISYQAVHRMLNPQSVHSKGMIYLAVLGFVLTLLIVLLFRDGKENLNIRSTLLHFLGDTFSYAGIVLGGLIMTYTGWLWVDPILSAVFAVIILKNAWVITRESALILLEAVPPGLSILQVQEALLTEPTIRAVSDLHIWSLSSEHISLCATVTICDMDVSSSSQLSDHLNKKLYEQFGITHTTIQFESDPDNKCELVHCLPITPKKNIRIPKPHGRFLS